MIAAAPIYLEKERPEWRKRGKRGENISWRDYHKVKMPNLGRRKKGESEWSRWGIGIEPCGHNRQDGRCMPCVYMDANMYCLDMVCIAQKWLMFSGHRITGYTLSPAGKPLSEEL